MEKMFTYLALGDSYSIGESVLLYQSFPYQVVQILRKKGMFFSAPEIIAKTGWTTDELSAGIAECQLLPQYSYLTLLIGVNNQYRGRSVEEYKLEFEALLKQSLQFVEGKKERVIILSIPDYSVTLFAGSMNKEKIAREIDLYNSVSKAVSIQYKVTYIDITQDTRETANDPSLLALDNLHPSAKAYKKWAEKVAEIIYGQLK
jgi:lysophospholipase L1-like esterase